MPDGEAVGVRDQDLATLIGFLVFVGLRLVDYLLPKGRHLKLIHRFTVSDDDEESDDKEDS